MHTTMHRKLATFLAALMAAVLVVTGCGSQGSAQPEPTEMVSSDASAQADASQVDTASQEPEMLTLPVKEIKKHGNVVLETTFDELRAAGIDVGDIVTVVVGGAQYNVPVGTSFTDVDSGEMVCRFDLEDNEVSLAVNMGSFAELAGIGIKRETAEDPGYEWVVKVPEVGLTLKEKEGYLDEYHARNLARTDVREDYASLTDEEFANFRAVSASGVGEGVLYRSSSPLDPSLGRNAYALAAMEAAGIRSVVNLADSPEQMRGYDAYEGSYYAECSVANPEMNYDFASEEFAQDVRDSVMFIAQNEGPYLVHCKEGKDRTGILCAILECFAGASCDEVYGDYMATYRNFYGVQPGDSTYPLVLNNNLVKTLCGLYGVDDLESADLKAEATEYLLSVGLTQADLDALESRLAGE